MSTSQNQQCRDLREAVYRYARNELPPTEADEIVNHIAECDSCREMVDFVRDFVSTLKGHIFDAEYAKEPCPSNDLLASVEAGLADEGVTRHVRAHVVHCRECAEKFLFLRGLSNLEAEESISEPNQDISAQASPFRTLLARASAYLIDLRETYRSGFVIGPVRILEALPAAALRGGTPAMDRRVLFEVSVGRNSYGVSISLETEGVSVAISGYRWPEGIPATVGLYDEAGKVLQTSKTDLYGNAVLRLDYDSILSRTVLFTIALTQDISEAFSIVLPEFDGHFSQDH